MGHKDVNGCSEIGFEPIMRRQNSLRQGHITTPHNYKRLYKRTPIYEQKPKDIRQEIANVVNNKHNTNWSEGQAKSKIAYVKSKYCEAAKKTRLAREHKYSTSSWIYARNSCVFTKFMAGVFLRILSHPSTADFGEAHTALELTDEDSSDLEDPSDTDSHTGMQAHRQVTDKSQSKRVNKRQKSNSVSSPAVFATSIEKIQELSDQHRMAYDSTRSELMQRDQAIEIRERDLTEKLFRIAEEARERLRQELATERTKFKKEMAEEGTGLKKEKAEFTKERDQLKMENASLRKELEVRTPLSTNPFTVPAYRFLQLVSLCFGDLSFTIVICVAHLCNRNPGNVLPLVHLDWQVLERPPLEFEPSKCMLNLDACRTMELVKRELPHRSNCFPEHLNAESRKLCANPNRCIAVSPVPDGAGASEHLTAKEDSTNRMVPRTPLRAPACETVKLGCGTLTGYSL
ncbi:MAG: hypothetical protein BYD32DRAFT_439033 [Podila humilis]|nr:MAG: hypothetical protein BYD32DRAFT_439033 [Podila humilis]